MKKQLFVVITMLVLTACCFAQNGSTAQLHGTIKDPNGAVVPGATVTARQAATNFEITTTTDGQGDYRFVELPPGRYTLTVTAPGFAKLSATDLLLNVGQNAELLESLSLAAASTEVSVTAAPQLVETERTAVSTTLDQQRINNLPINERSYLSFALTTSTVGRDNGRPVGPAPTSGLNIGGQRGRSTLVQVDGADNTDTSINAARSTLSQEAVQEFQVITNSYAPEYGRASGGVINVVSKGGGNDLHGNIFGFLRQRSFEAKNPFSPVANPPFTRTQYGATFGGPIKKDKTFFFASFEQHRRQESGFFTTDVAQGLGGSVTIGAPFLPFSSTFTNITPTQATYIRNLLATGSPALIGAAIQYAYLASSGGSTALNGTVPLLSPGGAIPAGQMIGGRFFLSGAPVPITNNAQGRPIAFRPLNQLQKIFPISESTSFSSIRLDHHFNENNVLTLRGGYNPSHLTGIQVESQNQALGQNDFSRTGIQEFHDYAAVASLTSTLTPSIVNELNFNYGRRAAQFRSQTGDAVAANIAGTAFFGRELFSPVRRTEPRYQVKDNVSWSAGHHLFKFGGDFNYVKVDATFELNFAGLFNFGGIGASTFGFTRTPGCTDGAPNCAPDFTAVQQYGLGFPSNFIQGFGNPKSSLSNKPIAFFFQDSWKFRPNLTFNYGLRYDNEITQQIATVPFSDPLSKIALTGADLKAAQDAIGVQQGIPRNNKNFGPRVALAWDPWSDGKDVIRAAYGIFYDHPLQAIAFNSDIADAVQQQQFVAIPGSPSPLALLNAVQIFQGTVCVPGAVPTPVCAGLPAGAFTPGVAAGSQYQFGRQRFNDQTFPGFGPVLPFTLPIARNFKYAYANQANLTLEHQFSEDVSLSMGYLMVGARHLPRPIDVNAPQNDLLIQNFVRFAGRPPANTTEASSFNLPTTSNAAFTVRIPGLVVVNNATGAVIVSPAAANFFRPNAPNYFLVSALTGGLVSPAALNAALTGSLRTPGVVSPFGSVNAQVSNGSSVYHAFNADLKKRFSHNLQFLASYTWSHSIDDSSDLQTLLLPQDNRNLRAERSNSLFDQRHRFVLSAVASSPVAWASGSSFWERALADFTFAPLIEISAGRPFNILTGVDTNNDQSNQTDRPNVAADGTLVVPVGFQTGNLGRNRGITRGYQSVDLRVTRAFRVGERFRLDVIGEGFNLLNKFNQASASPFFQDVNAVGQRVGNNYLGRSTAAFDPRQFQFGLKINF